VTWIAVGIGGALGSLARHAVGHLVQAYALGARFPAATVVVNLAGCFVIGLLGGALAGNRIEMRFYWREFVFVGLLGGFTTFSTFGLDTFLLTRTHSPGYAAINVVVQVAGGLLAVWAGYELAR
jgi:CrcB protein